MNDVEFKAKTLADVGKVNPETGHRHCFICGLATHRDKDAVHHHCHLASVARHIAARREDKQL